MKKCFKFLPILLAAAITANAQSLPNKQETSVWAPANIKIDGKANEWDGKFEAYNHATNIFYTIANDNDNIYLVVQTPDQDAINKIMGTGLTLTIQKPGKKGDKNNVSITYPLTDRGLGPVFAFVRKRDGVKVTDTSSTAYIGYNKSLEVCKWIVVSGIPGLDSISVYNENGIRAMGQFNVQKLYTLEMLIPLSYLRSVINSSKFIYNIRLNGRRPFLTNFDPSTMDDQVAAAKVARSFAQMNETSLQMSAPVDMWGEYTLAKKP